MILTTLTAMPFTASALDASGTIDGIGYTFDSATGVLTLSGTGTLPYKYDFYASKNDIKKIVIGEGFTEVGSNAFNNFTNVTELSLPSTLKRICGYAFGSLAITEINLPDGIEMVESSGFGYCDKVTSITIPASVSYLEGSSFDTTSVTSFNLSADNPNFDTVDGNLITEDGTKFIKYCGGKAATEFTMPDGVLHISNYAFNTAPNIKKVILPEGMTVIDDTAFRSCDYLEEVVLPSTLTTIDSGAFTYCSLLSKINLDEGLTTINGRAFEGCESLTEVTLPKSVNYLGSGAFYNVDYVTLKVLNPECEFYDGDKLFTSGKIIANEKCDGTCLAKDYATKYSITYETLSIVHELEPITAIEPTCTEQGRNAYYQCTLCSKYFKDDAATQGTTVDDERLPNLGHDPVAIETVAPTCREPGYTLYECNRCHITWQDDPTNIIAHTWDTGTVKTPATCTAKGEMLYKCTADGCNATKTEDIPALGHDMLIDEVGAQATCTEEGNLPYCYCRRCKNYYIDSEGKNWIDGLPVIKAKGHTSDSGTVTKKATYTAKGTKVYKCTVCGKTLRTESIPKLAKKANTIKVKAKTVDVKLSKLKKKNVKLTVDKALTVTKAKGTVTYKKTSGNKKITIDKKSGKITVKKGLKAGTYKVKIKVSAAGTSKYKKGSKTVTVKFVVKK